MSTKRKHTRPSAALVVKAIAWLAVAAAVAWYALSPSTTESDDAPVADTLKSSKRNVAIKQKAKERAMLWDIKLGSGMEVAISDDDAFRVYYNNERHLPNAVVYELTRAEASSHSVERKDEFTADATFSGSAQPYDYAGSGYDRGHMAPAGDMKWSDAAMKRTFLMSNICPQRHDLNSGSWNDLEIRVRQWAKRDSALVVITGPIVDSKAKRIGRSRVAVPSAFYKIVYAPYATPRRAIAFVMPNEDNVNKQLREYAVSVDEVERLTGYDFLYQLPDDTENIVEAQCNFSEWNRRR